MSDELWTFEEFMANEPARAREQHDQECDPDCDDEDCLSGYGVGNTRKEWYEDNYLAYFPDAEKYYKRPMDTF